jgi:hypothetical protein
MIEVIRTEGQGHRPFGKRFVTLFEYRIWCSGGKFLLPDGRMGIFRKKKGQANVTRKIPQLKMVKEM